LPFHGFKLSARLQRLLRGAGQAQCLGKRGLAKTAATRARSLRRQPPRQLLRTVLKNNDARERIECIEADDGAFLSVIWVNREMSTSIKRPSLLLD